MSSEPATTAAPAHVPADLSGADTGRTLAGLLDVLDRADGAVPHQHSRSRRPTAPRPEAYRRGAPRRVPLRPVPQAPAARPAPAGTVPPVASWPAPEAPSPGRLSALTRRVALWGAGADGEYLTWRATGPGHDRLPRDPSARWTPERSARPHRLRGLMRRLALWGAGADGEYLAWSSPASTGRPVPAGRSPHGSRPDADRPVVLRELPSTPTIQPVASSPATALLPHDPASSAGPRGARPVPSGAVPVPGVRPGGRLERSRATGWPSPSRLATGMARLSPAATGLVRARGDPYACPVRGSP
jgi:hypothetical protein